MPSAHVMLYFFHLQQEGGGKERSSHYLLDKMLCYFSGYQLITSELINLPLSQTLFFTKSLIKEAAQTIQIEFLSIAWIFQSYELKEDKRNTKKYNNTFALPTFFWGELCPSLSTVNCWWAASVGQLISRKGKKDIFWSFSAKDPTLLWHQLLRCEVDVTEVNHSVTEWFRTEKTC